MSYIVQISFFALLLVAIVIAQQAILAKMKRRDIDIAEAIFAILAADDPVLVGHSLHVLNLSRLFYDYLPSEYRIRIRRSAFEYTALLHDIGKIRIAKEILYKPGKLTGDEIAEVRKHADIGYQLIAHNPVLQFLSDGILYHHERVDGLGYKKMKDKDIPLMGKILAITDTYSAIILANSFKPSRTYSDAIVTLRMAAGSQLDKELVDIFCSIPQDKVNACIEDVMEKMEMYGSAR